MKFILLLILSLTGVHPGIGQASDQPRTKVAIVLYPGVELLDFTGPTEVFSLMDNSEVFTVASIPGPIKTMKNMLTITPDYSLSDCPQPDILVIPGAAPDHIRTLLADKTLMDWVKKTAGKTQINMSVCTGAYVFGTIGILDHKTSTTHWAATNMLQQMYPTTKVIEHARFVEDGNLVTTAGVSAGIDGALRVVARLRGMGAAQYIARTIEYDYWDSSSGLISGNKPISGKPKKTTKSIPKPVPFKAAAHNPSVAGLTAEGIDPVCKMTVPKGTLLVAAFGHKQYGFCSPICQKRFVATPSDYIK